MICCPLCKSKASRRFPLPHTAVWKCVNRTCGLQFAHQQPDEKQLGQAYRQLYYPASESEQGATFENTPPEVLRTFFAYTSRTIGRLVGLRMLDYGCGIGQMAPIALRYGLRVTGIETDASARAQAKRAGYAAVFENIGELQERGATEQEFDLVILWDVIEHLREPWRDLEKLRTFVSPAGRLVVATMNTDSLRARLFRSGWVNFHNPTHLFYFTRRSLRKLLEETQYTHVEEWKVFTSYSHHSRIRGSLQRALLALGLHGELIFSARRLKRPRLKKHGASNLTEKGLDREVAESQGE